MTKHLWDMTLSELAQTRRAIDGYIGLAVAEARRGGSTWRAIGDALGVSPQEAHRRYRFHDPSWRSPSTNETT